MDKKEHRSYYNKDHQMKYQKAKIRRFVININITTDADILEHLEGITNKQGYIKKLIRDDIAKRGV